MTPGHRPGEEMREYDKEQKMLKQKCYRLFSVGLILMLMGIGESAMNFNEDDEAVGFPFSSTWLSYGGNKTGKKINGLYVIHGLSPENKPVMPLNEETYLDEMIDLEKDFIWFGNSLQKSIEVNWFSFDPPSLDWMNFGVAKDRNWALGNVAKFKYMVLCVKPNKANLSLKVSAGNNSYLDFMDYAQSGIPAEKWTRIIIPLSDFSGANLENLGTINFVNAGNKAIEADGKRNVILLDSIYFTSREMARPVENFSYELIESGFELFWDGIAPGVTKFIITLGGKRYEIPATERKKRFKIAKLSQPAKISIQQVLPDGQVSGPRALTIPMFDTMLSASAQTMLDPSKAYKNRISPYIYGQSQAQQYFYDDKAMTISRWGGNRTTRYNWKNDCDAAGLDWYFLNDGPSSIPPFKERKFSKVFDQNTKAGITTSLTVPILGWIAKDNKSGSYPVTKFPDQANVLDGFGNGMTKDNKPLMANPLDTSIPHDSQYMYDWIKELQAAYGKSPKYLLLDNEPFLWQDTHRDVHPELTTYDEQWTKGTNFGLALRKADRNSRIFLGGWDMFYSPADLSPTGGWYAGADSGSDTAKHYPGVVVKKDFSEPYFAKWYLRRLKELDSKNGFRLVDGFDIHIYPEVYTYNEKDERITLGPNSENNLNQDMAEQRLKSVATLYDMNFYPEHTWWRAPRFAPTATLERLKRAIDESYPGTRIGIGEYNFGGAHHISGALTYAMVFGVYMAYDVEYATFWGLIKKPSSTYAVFRMFSNFDGKGTPVAGRYLPMVSSDPDLKLYAVLDDKRTFIVAVNTSPKISKAVTVKVPAGALGFRRYLVNESVLGKAIDMGESSLTDGQVKFFAGPYSMHLVVVQNSK